MLLRDLLPVLDDIAPTRFAESWDNVGLIVGDPGQPISKVLLAIDLTPEVEHEARALGSELVIAYHPPLFKAVKNLIAPDPLFEAIRRGMAIYSPHTALDVAEGGTNDVLGDLLGLKERQPLRLVQPLEQNLKLVTFVPDEHLEAVSEAMFAAGAGRIGHYTRCSFRTHGTGTFQGDPTSNPTVGKAGVFERTAEIKLELVCPVDRVADALHALRQSHPYEEPAFDLVQLAAPLEKVGQGRIGKIDPTPVPVLIDRIKAGLGLSHVLVSGPTDQTVSRAAVLAGGGKEHLPDALAQGAQLYLTGEIPHHDALAAAKRGCTVVATLHSNSERVTLKRVRDTLAKRVSEAQFVLSTVDRDPFKVV